MTNTEYYSGYDHNDLIKEVEENNLQTLDLSRPAKFRSHQNNFTKNVSILKTIPERVFELEQLTTLKINSQQISEIPVGILKLKNLKVLELDGNILHDLPNFITELSQLERLSLSKNQLSSLPNSLSEFQHLSLLDLTANKFNAFPSSIFYLETLTNLRVGSNGFNTIPSNIENLQNLEMLYFDHSGLQNLSDNLFQLYNLKHLHLGDNKISYISGKIGKLKQLRTLMLYRNNLSELPNTFGKLQCLEHLVLWNNCFSEIPITLYNAKNLQNVSFSNDSTNSVDCNNNNIRSISPKILNLQQLHTFELKGNPVISPPPEIVEQGVGAIKNYFESISDKESIDVLYEAKLLIIGEGGAGKTTLARKLVDDNYQLIESEKSTEGIEVTNYKFVKDAKEFRVNIWDFGGQEIYHSTHQFFLTKRSLYALVADTRKEDTDFFYWLNVVELLSDESPLLIVKNEKQDRHREISERQLRGQFINLKETLPTNLSTNRGLPTLRSQIELYISTLPHIGTPLPKSWIRVREILENHSQNHISVEEYFEICERNDFSSRKDKLFLIDYLHDLGVCLHFSNDPLLKKIVILKPKWGTDAVYKVLDNKTVINNLGRFKKSDLKDIWNDESYVDMQDEILQLMINFKLCYKILYCDLYIAPQLLSENQCQYQWDTSNNLIIKFEYDFMPKGILTQFIVEMHSSIENEDKVWKSGIILNKDGARAEIIENYNKRELTVRVMGKRQKELLTIINYELDKIHSSYKRLKYDKLIPCNCNKCKNKQNCYFYKAITLYKFIDDGQDSIQCQTSYEMVNVNALIDDLFFSIILGEVEGQGSNKYIYQNYNIQVNNEGEDVQLSLINGENVFNTPIKNIKTQQNINADNYITQNTQSGDNIMRTKESRSKSAWANGSFYIFLFLVVFITIAVIAGSLPIYVLPLVLISGIIIVPLIGALQLRQDDRLSDKSFIELVKITMGQLPLIKGSKENKSIGEIDDKKSAND